MLIYCFIIFKTNSLDYYSFMFLLYHILFISTLHFVSAGNKYLVKKDGKPFMIETGGTVQDAKNLTKEKYEK